MKQVKIIHNRIGKFNLIGNEENLLFKMAIIDENDKIMTKNDVKAVLTYRGEPEEQDEFEDALDNIADVWEKCWEYAKDVISTTDYKAQCLTFAQVYQENLTELSENRIKIQTEEINKEIERLKNRLSLLYGFEDIAWEVNDVLQQEIDRYTKWRDEASEQMEQCKKGTDLYEKHQAEKDKWQKRIDVLEQSKVQEQEY
jgi:hypothetical protein